MSFKLLKNRKIIDVIIGNTRVSGEYSLSYLNGPRLCEICTTFGLLLTYTWGSSTANQSRWEYMSDLLEFLDRQGRVPEFLAYIFKIEHFEDLAKLGDAQKERDTHKAIVDAAMGSINANLMIAGKELRVVNKMFVIADIGQELRFDAPKIKVVTSQYIKELPDRIKEDLDTTIV